jgi:hypothetical protein
MAPIFSRLNQPGNGFQVKLFKRINILIDLHSMAALYYARWNRYMTAPSIGITCLSSIAAFLSTSENMDNGAKYGLTISVGIMASVSTLLQSISNGYRFSAKEEMHRKTADEYNKLNIKLCFEMEYPNDIKFMENIENQILDIQNISNSFVPQFIIDTVAEMHKQKQDNSPFIPAEHIARDGPYTPESPFIPAEHIARGRPYTPESPFIPAEHIARAESYSSAETPFIPAEHIARAESYSSAETRPHRHLPLLPDRNNIR